MIEASALLIIASASSGYVYSSRCYTFKYRIARQTGYHLYLQCFSVGLIFLLLSWLCLHFGYWLGDLAWMPILIEVKHSEEPLLISIGSVFCALALQTAYNELWPNAQLKNLKYAMSKDDFDSICYRAMEERAQLAISLDSRKIYVGLVVDTLEPGPSNSGNSHLTILPLMSGYREEKTLKFTLSTVYSPIVEELTNDVEDISHLAKYFMAFPRSKINSLHIFNPDLHDGVSAYEETEETS